MGRVSRRVIAGAAVAVALASCSDVYRWDRPSATTYVVRRGDTLYNIAWRYGLDHRDLARWNGLGDGRFIVPGQRLALTGSVRTGSAGPSPSAPPGSPSRATPVAPQPADDPPPAWRWPLRGRIVARFGADRGARTGVLISASAGADVVAAADGKVVYAGSGLISYGQLLIVKHNDTHLSAYGHNESLLVGEGALVKSGQSIARVGLGPGQEPALHFEIRRRGDPIDPLTVLPP
ncbi:MAG: peptidoglycan DD-metalloendopeptidase family protein [Pseudomonadota bacterium]